MEDLDIFCHLIIEQFLLEKNLFATLRSFRSEWDRPDDTVTMPTWYNVALKLQMPELISSDDNNNFPTVLESAINALAQESSKRTRRPMDVVAHGLVSMPRVTILPDMSEPTSPFPPNAPMSVEKKERKKAATPGPSVIASPPPNNSYAAAMNRGNRVTARASSKLDLVMHSITADTTSLIPSKLVPIAPIDKYAPIKQNKASIENWIPDNVRLNQSMRGLKVAHQNVDDVIMLEYDLARNLKGANVTPYDQAIKEEELGVTKKVPCACCLQKFLYVNLPLKVSEKAIIDIRVKWTGGMTSQTVWSDTLKAIVTTSFEKTSSSQEDISSFTSPTKRGKLFVNTKRVPDITPIKVYSDVRVCLFCSQFFQFQESYRPSFADMVKAEKRAARQERLAREKVYWDPIRMVEIDREQLEITPGTETRTTTAALNDDD